MHKSIHNSDRKGIKYRMSYPRWSTSLVVNKQFWSEQSAVDQNETSKRNQLPHDPTTNPGIRNNGLWSHHPNPDTDIRKCTKNSCPLRHKWLHQQNTRMCDKHVNITWVADFRTTEEDKQTQIQHQLVEIDRDLYLWPGDSRTRGQHRFFQERSNYDTLRNSFQRTAREWNHE